MPKRALPIKSPSITLDTASATPLYKQLYERLRRAILTGQLEPGARLPSTRTFASELGVSRNTTALAYDHLLMEGYLESRVGQGTVVARHLPEMLVRAPTTRKHRMKATQEERAPLRLASPIGTLQALLYPERIAENGRRTFRGGEPALDLFPYEIWARLIARRARHSLAEMAYYQSPAGFYTLREAIAAHVGITRGVRCTAEQIIITAGSQEAVYLAVRTLMNPGEAAWIENPGYFGAQGALLAAGVRPVPVPIDEEGIVVAIGRQREPEARLVFTTPSHQFPTGVTMSLSRRLALLEWARQAGAWILEDDYDSEYRFSGRPLEALQGLDEAGRVLYIGTFSKTLFPALRVGYLIAPPELVDPLLAMRRFVNVHIPILEQMALADFMQAGYFARHIRRMRQHYLTRRDVLAHELQTHLGDLLDVYVPDAGMHLVGWLPADKDDRHAATLAAQAGVTISPLSGYSLEPLPRGGLFFGYAGTNEAEIRRGVRELAAALADL